MRRLSYFLLILCFLSAQVALLHHASAYPSGHTHEHSQDSDHPDCALCDALLAGTHLGIAPVAALPELAVAHAVAYEVARAALPAFSFYPYISRAPPVAG